MLSVSPTSRQLVSTLIKLLLTSIRVELANVAHTQEDLRKSCFKFARPQVVFISRSFKFTSFIMSELIRLQKAGELQGDGVGINDSQVDQDK